MSADDFAVFKQCMIDLDNYRFRESVLSRWLAISIKGNSVSDFLMVNNLNSVIVYGYGVVGKLLVEELANKTGIDIVAIIDKNAGVYDEVIPIISPDDCIPKHDIMLVTFMDTNYAKNLMGERSYNVVGIDELLDGFKIYNH